MIYRTFFYYIYSAKMFDEKGHRGMTVSFYVTGKERSGVVAVKVQKVSIIIFFNLILVLLLEYMQ